MPTTDSPPPERPGIEHPAYELFAAALSMLAIVNVGLYLLIPDPALETILAVMNGLFSVIFLLDFLYRSRLAGSFGDYFLRRFGWADLLSCLPIAPLKLLRLFRLVEVIRRVRAAGGRITWAGLQRERANSALLSLLLMGVLVLEFGSLLILQFEQFAPNASIVTGSDALWFTLVTIATVGYGDEYPVTDLGRLMGAVIIVTGVGIFGTLAGYLADLFLANRRHRADAPLHPAGVVTGDRPEPPQAAPLPGDDLDRAQRLELLLAQSQAMVGELQALLREASDDAPEDPA